MFSVLFDLVKYSMQPDASRNHLNCVTETLDTVYCNYSWSLETSKVCFRNFVNKQYNEEHIRQASDTDKGHIRFLQYIVFFHNGGSGVTVAKQEGRGKLTGTHKTKIYELDKSFIVVLK